MVRAIRATLERFRVHFDTFFSERSLHEADPSPVERHYAELERRGHIFRSEGAVWLRTSEFGDDKDRVLRRSDGDHTYFAADVAYHEDKRERGFDRLIDVLGRRPPRLRGAHAGCLAGAGRRTRRAGAGDHAVRQRDRARRARFDVQAPRATSSRSTT